MHSRLFKKMHIKRANAKFPMEHHNNIALNLQLAARNQKNSSRGLSSTRKFSRARDSFIEADEQKATTGSPCSDSRPTPANYRPIMTASFTFTVDVDPCSDSRPTTANYRPIMTASLFTVEKLSSNQTSPNERLPDKRARQATGWPAYQPFPTLWSFCNF